MRTGGTRGSRRRFIARVVGAGTALGLGLALDGGSAFAASAFAASAVPSTRVAPLAPWSDLGDTPIPVRMADMVQQGDDFRRGLAEGVRLPGRGGSWALTADDAGGRFTSQPLALDFAASHVGVHWQIEDGQTGAVQAGRIWVELRTDRGDDRWSPWRRVSVEAHGRGGATDAHATAREVFGALVGARAATRAQYRLTFGAATGAADRDAGAIGGIGQGTRAAFQGTGSTEGIGRVTLTYLDAGRTPPGRIAAAPTPTGDYHLRAMGGPSGFLQRVIPREAWGADESLRFIDGKDRWPRAFVAPKLMAVHHTATDTTYADPAAEVRAIYAYHTVTQDFGDIGYQLLIDNSGQAYEGRRGRDSDSDVAARREILSRDIVAGHAFGYNYGSVAIAMLGTFGDAEPGRPSLDTLEEALAFEAARHGLDPLARTDFLRARRPTGENELWRDDLAVVSGHRDCVPTECPGDRLYARLPDVRRAVADRLGAPGPGVRIARAPAARTIWPTDLVFGWEGIGGAAEFSTRLEGWRLSTEVDRIVPLSGYETDERAVWSAWSPATEAAFALPPEARGHYILHVRARTARGLEGAYAARGPLFVGRHVLADDADLGAITTVGAWRESASVLGFNGGGYRVGEPAATAGPGRFVWSLVVPEDGEYAVQACWTEGDDRATNARYSIAAGTRRLAEAEVNQQQDSGAWVELARVPLRAGEPCRVELTNDADGAVVADAIRLLLVAP